MDTIVYTKAGWQNLLMGFGPPFNQLPSEFNCENTTIRVKLNLIQLNLYDCWKLCVCCVLHMIWPVGGWWLVQFLAHHYCTYVYWFSGHQLACQLWLQLFVAFAGTSDSERKSSIWWHVSAISLAWQHHYNMLSMMDSLACIVQHVMALTFGQVLRWRKCDAWSVGAFVRHQLCRGVPFVLVQHAKIVSPTTQSSAFIVNAVEWILKGLMMVQSKQPWTLSCSSLRVALLRVIAVSSAHFWIYSWIIADYHQFG